MVEHIGHAAWRVLQNARKAAIARREKGADDNWHGDQSEVPGLPTLSATRRPVTSATVEYPGERKRSRHKGRSTGL